MDKTVIGMIGVIIGVVVGVALTTIKEWWFQNKKNQKEVEYLSIQIACLLDRFIGGCLRVCFNWDAEEVARRWTEAFPPRVSPQSPQDLDALQEARREELLNNPFKLELIKYTSGNTIATLTGLTFGGTPITGTDSICIVP